MGLHPIAIPFIVLSCFWGVVGIIIPWFIPKGPNRGIIRLMLVQTAFVCYVFWLLTYLMQLNPLIGPQLTNLTIYMMQREWGSYEPNNQH